MVIVLYNDDALNLEKRVREFVRSKALFLGSGPQNTHSHRYNYISRWRHSYGEVYDFFIYYNTGIKLYCRRNSIGQLTLKIEMSGCETANFKEMLLQNFHELKEQRD